MNEVKVSSHYYENSPEIEVHNKIYKKRFLDEVIENSINIEYLLTNGKNDRKENIRFNNFLFKMKDVYSIEIMDCVIFMEDMDFKIRDILNILSDEIKYMMKIELSSRFNTKFQLNNLESFFE